MDGAESSSESDMEEDNKSEEEMNITPPEKRERKVTPNKQELMNEDEFAGSTDLDEPGGDDDSGADTEDELQRVENESRQKKAAAQRKSLKEEDPYGGSTDENTDAEADQDHPIPDLPDFLNGKHFFLYGKFPNDDRRLLLRYIVAFNGVIEDYMTEKVQFVVTSEGWHSSFEDALMDNSNLCFVKPTWIYAINERQKLLPYQPYTVVP